MNKYQRLFRHYAEHHPKTSTAALLAGTAVTCWAMVTFIEMRDARDERRYAERLANSNDGSTTTSPQEAQLKAMIENAKKSSWKENLQNAADAQERFMLPGRSNEVPEYVKRIDERREEILREEKERSHQEGEREKDPSVTKFWR